MKIIAKENLKLTRHWDKADLSALEGYIKRGGYAGLKTALRMEPSAVVEEVKRAGLQGRGGGGFPAGQKWEMTAKLPAEKKYFICNLDESEPGTFKDRLLAENNPHQLIEGIIIGAYAIGASSGFVYLNGNFQLGAEKLRRAIEEAREKNILGRGVMGSAFDFELDLFQGAGAYICGEESALINSLEGKRGEPRMRPPFVCACGLWGHPTVVSNAETLANVPGILKDGWQKFREQGWPESPGTKLFCIDGAVENPGLYEAPIGTTLRELIHGYAGGMKRGRQFFLAQVGGSAGHLAPHKLLDEAPSYVKNANLPMGSGAILVLEKGTDIKALMLSWMRFFQRESCGQCVPCREGTFRLKAILERLAKNDFSRGDREDLEKLVWILDKTTFCALGRFSVTAIKDVMKYQLVRELMD